MYDLHGAGHDPFPSISIFWLVSCLKHSFENEFTESAVFSLKSKCCIFHMEDRDYEEEKGKMSTMIDGMGYETTAVNNVRFIS